MFEDWIKEQQTATDDQIEKDFNFPKATQKKWRLANIGPKFFRLGDKIVYPRKLFVEWFMKHMKNKQADVVPFVPNRTQKDISEK